MTGNRAGHADGGRTVVHGQLQRQVHFAEDSRPVHCCQPPRGHRNKINAVLAAAMIGPRPVAVGMPSRQTLERGGERQVVAQQEFMKLLASDALLIRCMPTDGAGLQ